ncbi:MAG: M1 family peptidase, partial [Ginsengibacter sp.]
MNCKKIYFVLLAFSLCFNAFAQQPAKVTTVFNPQELFAQDLYKTNGDEFRSANGAPGPKYWQNRADYNLKATIDSNSNQLTATESIHYINNSPDQLSSLWLQM